MKTILLVEDEEQVRTLLERVLTKRGFRVLSASNGRRALEIAQEQIADIDLVVSDLVMPELGGAALLRELHTIRADLPVLYMTGYSEEDVSSDNTVAAAHLIQKPFTPVQLLARIDEIYRGNQ